ncbi:MAG: ABC transporter ATP-binding protein [Syntrophales bacterium]
MRTVIEATNLCKTFGSLVAIADLSFAVAAGECFGILGPNGAGKTSMIRMIYAFSPPSGGTLSVLGMDITREARTVKSRIGVCQQENAVDPDLTVLQNLEVFASYFNIPRVEARNRARELLKFMALESREKSMPGELSGGMLRRLVIARALLNRPQLLILDEPTTGLDPQTRHQLWERLDDLKRKGLTILLTTHYMDEAARLCDRLLIIDKGRLLVAGKPAELIQRHVGRHVLEIVEPTSDIESFLREQGASFENLGHRIIVNLDDGDELCLKIRRRFGEVECILRMATLEDVFLRLTGRELRE